MILAPSDARIIYPPANMPPNLKINGYDSVNFLYLQLTNGIPKYINCTYTTQSYWKYASNYAGTLNVWLRSKNAHR